MLIFEHSCLYSEEPIRVSCLLSYSRISYQISKTLCNANHHSFLSVMKRPLTLKNAFFFSASLTRSGDGGGGGASLRSASLLMMCSASSDVVVQARHLFLVAKFQSSHSPQYQSPSCLPVLLW